MWYKEKINDMYNIKKYQTRFFKNGKLPKIIYILPGNFDYLGSGSSIFDKTSYETRLKLIDKFKKDCNDTYVLLDNIDLLSNDGTHYSIKGHEMVFDAVKDVFK